MSRPRRAFGSTRPGQLAATRVKVVAAELADPQRLNRGRRYARDGSVVDVTVDALATAAVVVGSRSDPYLVELAVEPGSGPPTRGELSAICTCPDAEPGHPSSRSSAAEWCKHAIAALLVLADEIAIEPELLDRWRNVDADGDEAGTVGDHIAISHAAADLAEHDVGLRASGADDRDHDDRDLVPDPLERQLQVPSGATMPLIPDVEPLERPLVIGDEALGGWVAQMHAVLRQQ